MFCRNILSSLFIKLYLKKKKILILYSSSFLTAPADCTGGSMRVEGGLHYTGKDSFHAMQGHDKTGHHTNTNGIHTV